jgi:DNA-binding NtrC family response regulator
VYIVLIDCKKDSPVLEEWLRERCEGDAELVVLDRDVVAAQLLRSDSPPDLVVRNGVEGFDTSHLLSVAAESMEELPPVVVLCDALGEQRVNDLGEPAFRALRYPVSRERFHKALDALLATDDGELGLSFAADSPLPELHFGHLVGESSPMVRLYRMLEKVARTDSTCLISGESGTGKENAASTIHSLSPRAEKATIPVNCGAIPSELVESHFFGHKRGAFTGAVSDKDGVFVAADGGTLFLDEVGELELAMQVKLLRVLQTGEVQPVGSTKTCKTDVRIVAATNRDLDQEMAEGKFREDLFYRLAVIPLRMPPLRERSDDIPLLLRHFAEIVNARTEFPVRGITRAALDAMCAYEWPGNVRELRAALERMIVLAEDEVLGIDDLPAKVRAAAGLESEEPIDPWGSPDLPEGGIKLAEAVDHYETNLILQALDRTGWNRSQAAVLLHMNRTTLVEKLKKKGLSAPSHDRGQSSRKTSGQGDDESADEGEGVADGGGPGGSFAHAAGR